jgi:hypothetical protein
MLYVDSTLRLNKKATAAVVLTTTPFVADIVASHTPVLWFVWLCVEVVGERCNHSAIRFSQSDPAVKLVIRVRIAYAAVKLVCLVLRCFL